MSLSIPFTPQPNAYSCGPTCVKMLLEYFGFSANIDALSEEMCLDRIQGVENESLISIFRKYWLRVKARENATLRELVQHIERGNPVVVNYYNVEDGVGHYAIVHGCSFEHGMLYFSDPRYGSCHSLSFETFMSVWHNSSGSIRRWLLVAERENAGERNNEKLEVRGELSILGVFS